uniref:Signal peptide containing protein n=3 Tax=Parascaris univalens TaxID=6257 RepID=A0A915B4N9_PARUN
SREPSSVWSFASSSMCCRSTSHVDDMWLLLLSLLAIVSELCIGNLNGVSEASFDSLRENEVECSFDNIRKMIGNSDFSILGKTSSCTLFYITGDELENKRFDITALHGLPSGCNDPIPFFYRKDNKYEVVVAQKKSVYVDGCEWQSFNSFHSCKFSRSEWRKTWVVPEGEVDEIVAHVTDIDTDILHVLYKDEEAVMFDGMYNLSSGSFVKNEEFSDSNFKLSSFDTDLKRLYYETDRLGYQEVHSDRGIFTFLYDHKQLTYFNESDYIAFSFSNKFYLVKKKYRGNRELYYIGNEENAEQLCISNTANNVALIMQIFVGGEFDDGSIHSRIREQISPKKKSTSTIPYSLTMNLASITTTSTISLILIAIILVH